jgi:hypothetical protein
VLAGRKRENRQNLPTFGPSPPPVRKQLAVLRSLPPGVQPSATTTRTRPKRMLSTMMMTRLKQHALQFPFKTARHLKNDVPWLSVLSKYMLD